MENLKNAKYFDVLWIFYRVVLSHYPQSYVWHNILLNEIDWIFFFRLLWTQQHFHRNNEELKKKIIKAFSHLLLYQLYF